MPQIKKDKKKQIISNIFSLSILQGTNYILPLIAFPYLVRVLGVDNYGLVAFAQAVIMYFNIVVDYGFNLSATREISLNKDNIQKVSNIFNSVMVIKLIMVLFSFSIFCILIMNIPKTNQYLDLYLMGFTMVLGQALFPVWFFQGIEKMKYITYINVVTKVLFLLALFIFVTSKNDYMYVLLINGIGLIISGLISLYIIYKNFQLKLELPSKDDLLQQLKQGWHLFIATAFGAMYRNANILVLGIFASNEVVGYYSIAERIVKIVQSLQTPIGQALYPYLSKKLENKNSFNFHKKYLKYVLPIYAITAVLIFFLSDFIINIASGSQVPNAVIDLKILSVVIIIGGLNYYFGVLGLVAMGFQKEFSKAILWTGIFNLAIVFILAFYYKDIGTIVSLILSEVFLLFLIQRSIKSIQ